MMHRDRPPDPDILVAIDALTVAVISVTICLWSDRLGRQSVLVPLAILARMAALGIFAKGVVWRVEIPFFILCTLLGAFNDWNSVVHHRIYRYTVPYDSAFSTIPTWMLLFWGMILRFFARLARWKNLGPPARPADRIGIGDWFVESPALKVGAQLLLILATRQWIYRTYLDPLFSWLPFLASLAIYLLFFFPSRHDLKLLAVFFVGGPAMEMLYIRVGHLHQYYLGWIGGVPLWIVLWWMLAILIWKDLSLRVENALRAWLVDGKRAS
ncbi:MAG: hypothetical protein GX444_00710 [Myxococcales bacterium]|nr:hypothetical protein [Myxococcales bacterium]